MQSHLSMKVLAAITGWVVYHANLIEELQDSFFVIFHRGILEATIHGATFPWCLWQFATCNREAIIPSLDLDKVGLKNQVVIKYTSDIVTCFHPRRPSF